MTFDPAMVEDLAASSIAAILLGDNKPAKSPVCEADDVTITRVRKEIKDYMANKLDDKVVAIVKKQLKSDTFDAAVSAVTADVLARFFELMFTRKSTWKSQLKQRF